VVEPIVASLEHPHTRTVILGERAFLNRLEGGCQVPIAAYGKIDKNTFTLSGLVATVDGKTLFKETLGGSEDSSESIGIKLAERLISMGAEEIIETLKNELNENYER
jgi:hydroxymethylbilane synthase